MNRYALLAILMTATALSLLPARPGLAQTDPSPELFQNFVGCYRSIIQDDDLFCVNSYQLPTNLTSSPMSAEAWCEYLVDQDGCTGDPVDPTAPWSLMAGTAYITLKDGDVVLGQAQVPRVGYSLGGLYFPAGHSITWGDPSIEGCVQSSATFFTTQEESCLPVFWNTEANAQADQRAKLGMDLVSRFLDLETSDPLVPTGGYVVNNLVTNDGRTIAVETLNVIDRILPNTFRSQSLPAISDGYSTPTSPLQLQSDINATATAFHGALEGTGSAFGLSGDAVGLGLFTVFGLVAFTVTYRLTENSLPLSVVAFLTTMLIGVPLGAVPVAVAAVGALLIFAVGGIFVLKKMGVT